MSEAQERSDAGEATQAPDVPEPTRPLLRVLSPDATPEEVAALVAVFAALGSDDAPPPQQRPEWNAPHRMARTAQASGPGGWRRSGLPLR